MNQLPVAADSSGRAFCVLDVFTGRERSLIPSALRDELDRYGVLVFPHFFEDRELAPIRRELDAHFARIRSAAATMTASSRKGEEKFACDAIPWDPIKSANVVFQEFHRHLSQRYRQLLRQTQDA